MIYLAYKKSMKKTLLFLTITVLYPALSHAQASTRKYETMAIAGFFVVAIIGLVIYYIIWKNKKKTSSGEQEKFKIKTFEVMKNGRKVVMTKKYRITNDEEFPEEVKRKKN